MSAETERFDIAVLGGGPGGYVAAIRAAQYGANVCLVEKTSLGGTCLNRGCIPTKSFYSDAARLIYVKHAGQFGIDVSSYVIDWAKMLGRKDKIVKQLVGGIKFLLKKNKITLVAGEGRLVNRNTLSVTSHDGSEASVQANTIIIATGSEPATGGIFDTDGDKILSSTQLLNLPNLPKSLLIIGAGYIGCEFASIFCELGVEVTLLDVLPAILGASSVDEEIISQLQNIFSKRGIAIKTDVRIKELVKTDDGIIAQLESGESLNAEKVLVSVGRRFNTDGIGLDNVGVATGDKSEIIVNDATFATNTEGVYAIGDVTGKCLLAHVASHQALLAIESIMKPDPTPETLNYNNIPAAIFTFPQVAGIGISEKIAREQGIDIRVGKFPYLASGKAIVEGASEGFVKVVVDRDTDKILGAHILGESACETIHEFAIAMENQLTAKQLINTVHAHPTLSETITEACQNAYGLSINI